MLNRSIHSAALLYATASISSLVFPKSAFAQDAEVTEEEVDEEIVVQATRSGKRVGDEAIRVDVIGREEIEEKILMTPGNISMLVAETPGVRVQVTSPGLGSSNVRVQGLRGRYTQLLTDGLPLYGGQASSIGLLQIPPTDLGRVEIIKGAASALYGPSALGGVINLVARRPRGEAEAEFLANATSREGWDLTGYGAVPLGPDWGASLTGGLHHQEAQDLGDDGWIDTPHFHRWTVRPRLFWDNAEGGKIFLTAGALHEERRGGTAPGRTVPDGSAFAQNLDTDRFDAGLTAEYPVGTWGKAHLRASAVTQKHKHLFGDVAERDRHATLFGEASLSGQAGTLNWLAGTAIQSDSYRSKTFSIFDYTYTVPALFAQAEVDALPDLTLSGSGRVDFHDEYGTRFSPRLSALYKPGSWRVRASVGKGFYAPTPFVEETEAAGLSRLEPLAGLKAETATSASVDVNYASGSVEASATLFGSDIDNAVRIEEFSSVPAGPADRIRLVNADGVTRTRGAELLLRYRWEQFTLTGSYVFVDSTEPDPDGAGRRRVPVTPRHTAGMVAMWESHGKGRIGFEAYYTGRQSLDDNPYRNRSKPYFELGLLGEIVLGKTRLFLNAENILDIRQSRYDPLVLPSRAADGRWTVDAWAPLDGFVLNGGIRVQFGGGAGH